MMNATSENETNAKSAAEKALNIFSRKLFQLENYWHDECAKHFTAKAFDRPDRDITDALDALSDAVHELESLINTAEGNEAP